MIAGVMLLSLAAAAVGGAIVWAVAGFWWAAAAYVGIGAGVVLLIGVLRAMDPGPEAEAPHRLADPKVAG